MSIIVIETSGKLIDKLHEYAPFMWAPLTKCTMITMTCLRIGVCCKGE